MSVLCGVLLLLDAPRVMVAEASAAAVANFNSYSRGVEARLVMQHRAASGFLVAVDDAKIRRGEVVVERLSPGGEVNGAMLHHWRGTAFAPGAAAADFERLMRDFKAYPQHFAPQVVQAGVTAQSGDRMEAWMRVKQRHVITMVMDTSYDVTFGRLDAAHGYSISESTRVNELDGSGGVLSAKDEHGFLWRMNTYWSYEERDGGLYLQVESVSLTRAIPAGLGWALKPYVESIPRESMEFTLRSAVNAMKK
jgi:hypothetical protein